MTEPSEQAAIRSHRFLADGLRGNARLLGAEQRWVAPISFFDAPTGFSEEVWLDASPITWLSRKICGAPVTCQWGRLRDTTTQHSAPTLQPRGAPNHFSASGPIRFTQLFLPDTLIDRVGGELLSAGTASRLLRTDLIFLTDPTLDRAYEDYAQAATSDATSLELEARAILIVARLLRHHHGFGASRVRQTGGLSPRQLKRACDAMSAHLSQDVALEQIARVAGVSATHFSRAFKQSMGMPPFAWLLLQRIERAKAMLARPTESLADIALAVGFSAQPQFTTAFRRVTGTTPGAWRRDHVH